MAMATQELLSELEMRLKINDPSLSELRLAYNNVGDFGASAIGRALTNNSVLQKLSLASAQIGQLGIEELCKGVAHNRRVQGVSKQKICPSVSPCLVCDLSSASTA